MPELERAPAWDGHTAKDVTRLASIDTNRNTFSVYPVSQESALLYLLDNGVQEEILCSMGQLLEELAGTAEYNEFIAAVDIHSTDCLLTKAW